MKRWDNACPVFENTCVYLKLWSTILGLSVPTCTTVWSERRDLNPRPLHPQCSALPGCATLRQGSNYTCFHNEIKYLVGPSLENVQKSRAWKTTRNYRGLCYTRCSYFFWCVPQCSACFVLPSYNEVFSFLE